MINLNPEINTIVGAIPKEFRALLEQVFTETLKEPSSIRDQWDHGFSEARTGGFKIEMNGYEVFVMVAVRAEYVRPNR